LDYSKKTGTQTIQLGFVLQSIVQFASWLLYFSGNATTT